MLFFHDYIACITINHPFTPLFCLKLRNFPGSEEKRVSSTHYLDWKHYKVTMGLMPWQSEMSPHCFMDRLEFFFIYPTWVKENCKKISDKNTVCNMVKIHFEKYKKVEKIKNFEIEIAKQMQGHNQLLTILIKIPMKF